jgi:hypothetical protein
MQTLLYIEDLPWSLGALSHRVMLLGTPIIVDLHMLQQKRQTLINRN